MPFITPTERRGMEKGLIQGLEQGLEKGRREAMFEVIHLVLNEKYGAKGLELMAELKPIQEMDLLRAITQKLIQGGTLPSFRRWLSARLK